MGATTSKPERTRLPPCIRCNGHDGQEVSSLIRFIGARTFTYLKREGHNTIEIEYSQEIDDATLAGYIMSHMDERLIKNGITLVSNFTPVPSIPIEYTYKTKDELELTLVAMIKHMRHVLFVVKDLCKSDRTIEIKTI